MGGGGGNGFEETKGMEAVVVKSFLLAARVGTV